jgi:hypothetical protein
MLEEDNVSGLAQLSAAEAHAKRKQSIKLAKAIAAAKEGELYKAALVSFLFFMLCLYLAAEITMHERFATAQIFAFVGFYIASVVSAYKALCVFDAYLIKRTAEEYVREYSAKGDDV